MKREITTTKKCPELAVEGDPVMRCDGSQVSQPWFYILLLVLEPWLPSQTQSPLGVDSTEAQVLLKSCEWGQSGRTEGQNEALL